MCADEGGAASWWQPLRSSAPIPPMPLSRLVNLCTLPPFPPCSAKTRVVLVRFCARALLQQLYRRAFVEGSSPGGVERACCQRVVDVSGLLWACPTW
jgi:hypothetical protein